MTALIIFCTLTTMSSIDAASKVTRSFYAMDHNYGGLPMASSSPYAVFPQYFQRTPQYSRRALQYSPQYLQQSLQYATRYARQAPQYLYQTSQYPNWSLHYIRQTPQAIHSATYSPVPAMYSPSETKYLAIPLTRHSGRWSLPKMSIMKIYTPSPARWF